METKRVTINAAEGLSGRLPLVRGTGTWRILLDRESCGAERFALLSNEIEAGGVSSEHSHTEEHALYVLEGEGMATVGGKPYPLGPGTAVFLAPRVPHRVENTGRARLAYLVLYAPPGPEQQLRQGASFGPAAH